MSIYEYDQEKHMKWIREEGREEGLEVGLYEGEIIGYIKHDIKAHVPMEETIADIMNEFKLEKKEAQNFYQKATDNMNKLKA